MKNKAVICPTECEAFSGASERLWLTPAEFVKMTVWNVSEHQMKSRLQFDLQPSCGPEWWTTAWQMFLCLHINRRRQSPLIFRYHPSPFLFLPLLKFPSGEAINPSDAPAYLMWAQLCRAHPGSVCKVWPNKRLENEPLTPPPELQSPLAP